MQEMNIVLKCVISIFLTTLVDGAPVYIAMCAIKCICNCYGWRKEAVDVVVGLSLKGSKHTENC